MGLPKQGNDVFDLKMRMFVHHNGVLTPSARSRREIAAEMANSKVHR